MRVTAIPVGLLLILPALLLGAPPAEVQAQQGKSHDEMREANKAASVLLLERMRRDRPEDYGCLKRIRRPDLLVVRGAYDHVEWVLRDLGVPFARTDPAGLDRTSLDGVEAVLVNCPGRIGAAGARRLAAWVREGGLLLTTDWAVLHVLEPAFPGMLRYTRKPTRDDVVSIRVLRPEHLFLRHVLTGNDRHVWWLESQSYPFEVLDRRRVEVLIDSREMAEKYGSGNIAATFPAGRGRVVHIASHFYLQRSELRTARDRIDAKGFAGDLGFPAESEAVRKLGRAGLAKVPTGKLRSAYSAQQLLANLLVTAKKGSVVPDPPRPPPRPAPRPPIEKPSGGTIEAARATVLRDAPGGSPVKALAKGLRLTVISRGTEWVHVRTPAGEAGWVSANAVR